MPWGLRWRNAAPEGGREVESAAGVPSYFSLDLVHTVVYREGVRAKVLSATCKIALSVHQVQGEVTRNTRGRFNLTPPLRPGGIAPSQTPGQSPERRQTGPAPPPRRVSIP